MDPWAFGWTQVLTLLGMAITTAIAVVGFRTFGKWKREKLEERRMEVAFEALSLAYESKYVFEHIRTALIVEYEWADMPNQPGETEDMRRSRGAFYAVLKRIDRHRDFFDRVLKLQPRFMAMFGSETEEVFMLLHRARRDIEVACDMLADNVRSPPKSTDPDKDFWIQLRADIYGHGKHAPEGDRVGKKLDEFRDRMVALCKPVLDRGYKGRRRR